MSHYIEWNPLKPMFTGIIEAVRPVVSITTGAEKALLEVDLGPLAEGARIGDSIAIDGACLTVSALKGTSACFDVSTETLRRTTLGRLRAGAIVNCERALRLGDRLGGHFVLGHVDGVGTIAGREESPGQVTMRFRVEPDVAAMTVPKGSIAVDGISLTLVDVWEDGFSVALIPTTLANTTLGRKGKGDPVNIETDVLGKWIKRFMAGSKGAEKNDLTLETLKRAGFA